ncbi:MAG: hypothetical protein QF473_36890, partial [Planctomycetota bacterium]|nr:hypothetical protein [Planctomycetota bacterium]
MEVISISGTEYTVGSEAQHGEYNLEFKLETGSKPADLIFGYQDATRFYRLSVAEGQATLTRILAGLQQQLAQATVSEFTSLTIRRRRHRLSILFGEDALLQTGDGSFHEGKIAIAISDEQRKLLKFRYQPVTDIYFADDFMRAQADDAVWKTVSGEWKITSTIDKHLQSTFFKEDNFSRSSNPFIFEGDAKEDQALSVVGRSFWDEYDFRFSMRGSGGGGCAFFIQDASHYYGLEWKLESVFPVASELRLFCRDGELISELAAAKLPGKLNQWYGVEVYAGPERIRVQIDDRKYIDVPHTRYSKGKAGLFVTKGGHAQFDDVLIKTPTAWELACSETLLRGKEILVTAASGTEKTKGATWQVIKKPDGAALQARGEDAASVYWLGHRGWRANCFSTMVEMKRENTSAGIMFDWRDAKNFMLAVKRNELVELIQLRDGQLETLNSARLST